ncbi:MAG: cysteine desulfurase [Acidimicrobiia bacterium]|nr:cysteine desulfurase [Acidimicrobiia bacterium]
MSRHYLDHASTSPLRPEARQAIVDAYDRGLGDPARIHTEGMEARALVEQAREQVAMLVGARSREVVFTSGATESIAAAVWGASRRGSHQVLTAVEHSAVREQAERAGEVTVVGVDRLGRVDPAEVLGAIRPGATSVVHVQWGNHEVGTRQPLADIVHPCRDQGVLVHVDAAQAVGHDPISFADLGADLVSVSAHKFGGPAGMGALLVRRGLRLEPLLLGGDQERARRGGHENTPAILGFGAAATALLDADRLGIESTSNRRQTERVVEVATQIDGVEALGDPNDRLPHIVCLGIAGVEPQPVLIGLDRAGVSVHSGSSCSSESIEPSPVLEAMGVDAQRSLRISVGWSTTDADIDALLDALPRVVADLRRLAGR